MKILVVDDDPVAIELIEAALTEHGFTNVVSATSGVDALKIIESSLAPFECFLLDLKMPEMDGIKLCTRIRQYPAYKTAPVLFITAASHRSCITGAYAAGAVDYVSKPIDPLEIGIRVSVAEKLVLEEQAHKKSARKAEVIQRQMDGILAFSISDPIAIADVPKVINKLAIENYLLGLNRPKLHNSLVTAFAINDFRAMFRKAGTTEMYFLLADIAKAISKSLNHADRLISYYGHGEFILVTKRDEPFLNEDLVSYINASITRLELAFEDGSPCDVTVAMGNPAKLSMWSPPDPLHLVQLALESVSDIRRGFRVKPSSEPKSKAFNSPILNL